MPDFTLLPKSSRSILLAATAFLILATAQLTHAQLKTAVFTGTLNSITSTAPYWEGISVGDTFTVTVNFDMTPNSLEYNGTNFGQYEWADTVASITAEFGDYTFSSTSLGAITVENNPTSGFRFFNAYPINQNGIIFIYQALQISLQSESDVTTGPHLDAIREYPLEDFSVRSFSMNAGYFNGITDSASVTGTITSYTIPEPSSWALLSLGVLALGHTASRRRKAA